jgi:hypothetical protein
MGTVKGADWDQNALFPPLLTAAGQEQAGPGAPEPSAC